MTTTNNTDQPNSGVHTYLPSEIVNIFALTLICVMGSIGNFLVVYVFAWKRRKNRKRFESLLAILAVVDMFASMVVPTLFLYGTVTKYRQWHFGYIGCKVISSLFPASVTISQGILILISYERYKSIKNPFERPLRKLLIYIWLLATLLIALLLVSPYIYVLEMVSSIRYDVHTCMPSEKENNPLLIYSTGNVLRDFAAFTVMLVFGVMSNRLLKHSSKINSRAGGFCKARQRNTIKARKMLVVVVSVFSFCIIPLDLYQMIIYIFYKTNFKFSKTSYKVVLLLNSVLSILQVANSATNVIIYSRMHKGFTKQLFSNARQTFRNISRKATDIRRNFQRKEHGTVELLLVENALTKL